MPDDFSFLSYAGAALLGGLVSAAVNWLSHRQIYKTEFAAERGVRRYLQHKTHIRRSFATLEKRLGGFAGDELRKILVRAGAVRTYDDQNREYWYLLSRQKDFKDKHRKKRSVKVK